MSGAEPRGGALGFPAGELDGVRLEDAAAFAGVPDQFQRMWTPHRMAYIRQGPDREREGCPFCEAPQRSDQDGLIVHRGERAFVLLNLYPYNSGHLLVCPYRHIANYDDADEQELREIALLTQTAMRVHRRVSRVDGFNIGMNQGAVAGAGIAGHLHQHIVPRWAQDANFFPVIARVKALPVLLEDVRVLLQEAWPQTEDHPHSKGQQ